MESAVTEVQVDLVEINKQLDRAKIGVLTRSYFLASLSFQLQHRLGYEVPTAGTDGLTVVYNPVWFGKLDKEAQIGLVAHEVWHVGFDHMSRIGDRDRNVWNQAADYVINALLVKHAYVLPEGGLYDPAWRNGFTEDIYEQLIKDPPPKSYIPDTLEGDMHVPGSLTDDFEGGTSADIAAARQRTTEILSKARIDTELNDTAGSIPAEINRHIDKLLNPVLSWQAYLERFLWKMVKQHYSYNRPNKRFMPIYLPSQRSPTIGNITIAIDTSGSISQKQLAEILTEIQNIRDTFSPDTLTIIAADHKIQTITILERYEDIANVDLKGGGGTSFFQVLDYCKKHVPDLLIYFTDLYAEHINEEAGYPTIWVCYSKHRPQGIGETIYYTPKSMQ